MSPSNPKFALVFWCLLIAWIANVPAASCQTKSPADESSQPAPTAPDDSSDSEPATLFPHIEWDRIWLSGQANIITQWHPAFRSPYQGPNSLTPEAQDASSRVLTLFLGLRLTATTALLADLQETGGHGLGEALGLAGFTNLDVVRNPTLGKSPYIARLMIHQIIPLGRTKKASDPTPLSLFRELPERRLEVRFGKFSLG